MAATATLPMTPSPAPAGDSGSPPTVPLVPRRPTCSSCPCWERRSEDRGLCHRYPPTGPVAMVTADGPVLAHAVTLADGYCFEHPGLRHLLQLGQRS